MNERVDPFGWRTALVCGLLWGIAVSLADVLIWPVGDLAPAAQIDFALGRLWQWTPAGLVWVLGAKLLACGRWAALRTVPLLPIALAAALAAVRYSPMDGSSGGLLDNPMGEIPFLDLAVFMFWTNLFFGGLYVIGYLVTRRAARLRQRLTKLRRTQSEADTLLREARVNAYRGQLQPAMLLAALEALRCRYRENQAAGDQLFDLLIAFLRAAMPSVRSGFSTLGAELETVRSYASLRDALDIAGPRWLLDFPPDTPALPFPSLILLPALEELANSLPPEAELRLTVERTDEGAALHIEADGEASLSGAIDRRLRGGLALTFGSSASVSANPVLPVQIRLRAQALGERCDAYPSSAGDEDEAIPKDGAGHPLSIARDR
jgi:hypothetical protein